MTALIKVVRGKRTIAQCDERCYEARIVGEGCDCVCCGHLHGLGAVQAGNELISIQPEVTAHAKQTYGDNVKVVFNIMAYQPKLPLFE